MNYTSSEQLLTVIHENVMAYFDKLDPASQLYFKRSFDKPKKQYRLPHFYALPKVHKSPLTLRPVISTSNSITEIASKWCEHQLNSIIQLCPANILDSIKLRQQLINKSPFPYEAAISTSDTKAYYPSIPTQFAVTIVEKWLQISIPLFVG